MQTPSKFAAAIVALLAVTVSGCGTTGGPASADGVAAVIGAMPDDEQWLAEIWVADFQAATDLYEADRSDPDAWLETLHLAPDGPRMTHLAFEQRYHELDAWRSELGFAITDTNVAVTLGRPPHVVHAHDVATTAEDIDEAIRQDPTWGPDLTDEQVDGHDYWSWSGEGASDLERTTVTRPLGRGGTMAMHDDILLRTVLKDDMEAVLTAESSLMDRPDMSALMGALQGSPNFVISNDPIHELPLGGQPTAEQRQAMLARLGDGLAPYTTFAMGSAPTPDEPAMIVALWHADEATAADNAERLEQVLTSSVSANTDRPWSDVFADHTITVDGQLLTATLQHVLDEPEVGDVQAGVPRGLWHDLLRTRDSLLWIGPEG